jgi:hypothetical protein
MVLGVSYRVEKGEVLLTVRSLHQDEHHHNGDIRVTSKENGPSIRQIILEHSRWAGLTIVSSEDELGDPTQYTGAALPSQQDRTTETPLPPRDTRCILGNRPTTQETPRIICEFDFSSLKPTTTRWSHNQHSVSVSSRKGQTRIIEVPANSTTEQTDRRYSRGVNSKKNRTLAKTTPFPLTNLVGTSSKWKCLTKTWYTTG